MKLAILADIHSNLEALQVALRTLDERGVDALYCCGDLVGYGPDPAACVDLIRERCDGVVLGNHDEAVAFERNISYLPKEGQVAVRHNRDNLSEEQRAYLRSLPLRLDAHGCTFAHASPQLPEAWMRIDTYQKTMAQFEHFETDVCFLGHTHMPAVMANKIGVLSVRAGYRYLINVGSVGQPRDHNPRLALGFFDTEAFTYELVRIPYNVEKTAARIAEEGLPHGLGQRLKVGQ